MRVFNGIPRAGGLSAARGYTLVEMLTVLAIIGIVGAAGVPRIETMLSSYDLSNTAESLAADLRLARMRAVARNARARIHFRSSVYVVQRESPRGSGSYVDDGAPQAIPARISVAAVPTSPSFNSRGLSPLPATITLTGPEGSTKTITVNGVGRVAVN